MISHPPDWSEKVHITGYWFQEVHTEWRPSLELEAFLDNGKPPVYIGFGSMVGRDPESFAALVLDALKKSGQRGMLLTGWGALNVMKVPDHVFVVKSAPHSWLFPRMGAVVHHGGAGTTAEGLRAGVPTVIIPFIVDQPFWGKRVQALGVGPKPIPAKELNAEKLAAAIQEATLVPELKERAAVLGATIRAEDGVGSAVKVVRQLLGE